MLESFKFKELSNFVLDILVTPHSNASCERVFSKINLIKTDIRNRLCSETINGLLLASQSANKECYSFEISEKMIKTMTKDIYSKCNTEEGKDADVHFEEI